jgi:adenylosuccinate synthase
MPILIGLAHTGKTKSKEKTMKTTGHSVIMIADLGYGDAGKGSLVDSLARVTGACTVVRYNGGAQAAHNVITNDGRHHTFAQFGSGAFVPGVSTHLSRFMMINPLALLAEERHLQSVGVMDAFERMTIDRDALVTTPFQQSANRIREIARGAGQHGSCGMGIGETMSDWLEFGRGVLFAGDLDDRPTLMRKLAFLRDAKLSQIGTVLRAAPRNELIENEMKIFNDPDAIAIIADVYAHFASLIRLVGNTYLRSVLESSAGTTIFEGAQGVLLDEWFGFYPYNSWSTLTFKNAAQLLDENDFSGETLRLGLLRAYATRHGAGPFVTEDAHLTRLLPDQHNVNNAWQHGFRVGYLDFVTLRYALNVCGQVDGLVITNLDRMHEIERWRTCSQYEIPTSPADLVQYFDLIQQRITAIKVPADPTDLGKQERLTRLLMQARPIYDNCERDINAYLQSISAALNLPAAITSNGPTASAKEYFYLPGIFSYSPAEGAIPFSR